MNIMKAKFSLDPNSIYLMKKKLDDFNFYYWFTECFHFIKKNFFNRWWRGWKFSVFKGKPMN